MVRLYQMRGNMLVRETFILAPEVTHDKEATLQSTNVHEFMRRVGVNSVDDLRLIDSSFRRYKLRTVGGEYLLGRL